MTKIFTLAIPLFILMDFIGTIPIFITLTNNGTTKERTRAAVLSSIIAGVVILLFALIGQQIRDYFDLSLEAIKVGGGLLLLYIAFEMILAGQTIYEKAESVKNVIVSPLAIPMLAGPGSMSFAMVSYIQLVGWEKMYIILAILLSVIVGSIVLITSSFLKNILGEEFMRGLEKVTAIVISFIALEMIMSGIKIYFYG